MPSEGWVPEATSWEVAWSRSIVGWPRWAGWPLEIVMQTGTRWFFVVVAIGLFAVRQRRPAIAVLVAGGTAWLGARLLKEWFDRPRPTAEELQRPLRELASGYGFPSSHTSVSTAIVVVLVAVVVCRRPALGRPAIVAVSAMAATVAVMTALGRIYVGAHWPLDTVGGAVLGTVCGAVMAPIVLRASAVPA